MPSIEGGRWDRCLRRMFSVKGTEIAPNLMPELAPSVIIQGFEPEMYYLRDERLGGAYALQNAVAGEYGAIRIANPEESESLVILNRAMFFSGGAAVRVDLNIEKDVTALANAATTVQRDSRLVDQSSGATIREMLAQVTYDTAVAKSGDTIHVFSTTAANEEPEPYQDPIILGPGWSVTAWGPVNVQLRGSYGWRERAADANELT